MGVSTFADVLRIASPQCRKLYFIITHPAKSAASFYELDSELTLALPEDCMPNVP